MSERQYLEKYGSQVKIIAIRWDGLGDRPWAFNICAGILEKKSEKYEIIYKKPYL